VDLRYIQELLDRKSSKTTEIYIHIGQWEIGWIKSPLDFGGENKPDILSRVINKRTGS